MLESCVEIASLRIYFASKTYFSEHHSQNLYNVYYAYNLNIYFICKNESLLAADGAMNICTIWQLPQARLIRTWPHFSFLLFSLAHFGLQVVAFSAIGFNLSVDPFES